MSSTTANHPNIPGGSTTTTTSGNNGSGGHATSLPTTTTTTTNTTTTSSMTMMSNVATDQQTAFSKQATILRKNLAVWNHNILLHNNHYLEDWPKMLGRSNAASNQCTQLNSSIEDVMDHFVIVPKQSPANPSDIPFFLATRIDLSQQQQQQHQTTPGGTASASTSATTAASGTTNNNNVDDGQDDDDNLDMQEKDAAFVVLHRYETTVANIAKEYEDEMIRF